MNNLTTRKIVLGLVMTLVLAFGVQGIVNAVTTTLPEGPTVDIDAKVINDGITAIVITPTLEDTADNPGVGDHTDTVNPPSDRTNTIETITISTSGIQLTSPTFATSLTLSESTTTETQTNTRRPLEAVTLNGYFTRVGVATLTISYTDLADSQANEANQDAEGQTSSRSRTHRYTYYVVRSDAAILETTILRLTQDGRSVNSEGYISGLNGRTDFYIQSGSGDYPITYSVSGGSAALHTGATFADRTALTAKDPIASRVRVWLDMNGVETFGQGATSVVRVRIGEDEAAPVSDYNVVYIIGTPELDITLTAGTDITLEQDANADEYSFTGGAAGDNAGTITATVTDGAVANVPGVLVKFDLPDKTVRGGYLSVDSGAFTIANDKNQISGTALDFGRTLYVRTNASGAATVTYQLGTSSQEQVINVTSAGKAQTVTAALASSERPQKLFIETNQRQGNTKKYDLVAEVKDDEDPVGDMVVTFRTNRGTLTRVSAAPGTGPIDTGRTVNVVTNALGKAHVVYDIGENTGRQEIHASIYDADDPTTTNVDERTLRQEITFVINGPAGTGGQPQSPPPGTVTTASVSSTSITGAPDSTHLLTIVGPPNTPVTISQLALVLAGGSASPVTNTGATGSVQSTITLPSTIDTYSFTVNIGGTVIPVSIEVTTETQETGTGTLSLDVPVSGAPGDRLTVEVTATMADGDPGAGVDVALRTSGGIGTLSSSTVRTDADGEATATLTLGTAGSTGFVTATASGYGERQLRVTVSGEAPTPTPPRTPTTASGLRLLVFDGNNQTGEPNTWLTDPLVVTVVNSAGQAVPNQVVQFTVTRGGGRISPASPTTNASGQAQARLRLGRNTGTNTVTATINGVSVTFTATAALAPAYLEVYGESNRRGTLNNELADPLVVQVLDEDENGVADVRVTFQVTSRNARLTQRGTGFALRVDTDRNGMAEAPLTPTGAGTITVQATANGLDPVTFTITTGPPPASLTIVSGNNQAGNPGSALANPLVVEVQDAEGGAVDGVVVTFEVTAGGGTLSAETATTNAQGRAQTSLTLGDERAINSVRASVTGLDPVTFNTSVDAVIHVAAANRPVMYWIDGGALYHLAGARAQQIAASASDVAVDMTDGKIYWIEATSDRTGRIHSANVDGTGAMVVKELTSVPMGLAHDSADGKLYLTNSWGKIQRMNDDGTQFETNFIVNLGNPMDIAVSSGSVYWTDAAGSVRYANTAGTKIVRNIATGSGALGGIAADSNKVYWTEQTGDTTGRIRSANLDGTGIADVFSLTAVPAGIAVDGNTVYWANGWGKVQRRNVDRSKFQDIVTGLMSPGAVAIGGANVATPSQPQTPQPTTTVKSKYDVNNDGTVDTTDVGIVVAAVLSGSQQASLDVNGDGTVDLSDVVAVSQNVDDSGTAGAPALRVRLSAVQVDRIQEQIDLLLAMNDRSPGALYTLQYLQNLLASARPGKTQLLANYPNPFNPETWIPYELATDTNVKLTIYDAQGIVVRTLSLGHQSAGYYTSRDRAAYWDGRNSSGELVASGLYFYQLETDETSTMRKMVILK